MYSQSSELISSWSYTSSIKLRPPVVEIVLQLYQLIQYGSILVMSVWSIWGAWFYSSYYLHLHVTVTVSEPCLERLPLLSDKCGLSRQVVSGDRFNCIELQAIVAENCGLSRQVPLYCKFSFDICFECIDPLYVYIFSFPQLGYTSHFPKTAGCSSTKTGISTCIYCDKVLSLRA